MTAVTIAAVRAREILDSRGNPTVEVDVRTSSGAVGSAAVPSGASTGSREALELRDGDPKRYAGKGVQKAVANVERRARERVAIGRALGGLAEQEALDRALCESTAPRRSRGSARTRCSASRWPRRTPPRTLPACRSTASSTAPRHLLPAPMMNVINGGAHADNTVDLQEFMLFPLGAPTFSEALRWGAEVFHKLKKLLGDEGLCDARSATRAASRPT